MQSRTNRSESPAEIVLHLGAHKTATTYLQTRLARSINPLLEENVLFVPLRDLRDNINLARNVFNPLNHLYGVRDLRTTRVYRRYLLAAAVAECHRLVISEENLLGDIDDVVQTGILYPKLKKRLTLVFKGLNEMPVTALLAVRSYDSWMVGMWSQFIRKKGYRKMDEQVKARLISSSRGWADVIDEVIRILPPGSRLRVWRYEDLSKLQNDIFALFVGAKNISKVESVDQYVLPSLSARAMKRLENLHAQGMPTGPSDVKRVGNNFSKDKGFKPYSPWTDEERKFLVKKYELDIARIRERWPELMLLPSSDDHSHS